jgi:XTP/dITP diphosphohydrolase
MEILLATSNEHKAKAVQAMLGRPVQHLNIDLPEIQAIDVREVIERKAREAYRLVGKPVLVEDTSLSVHAWNGLPGALIRWFLETVGNEGICKMLEGYKQLEATAETCLGYFDGETFISFSGLVEGHIARHPRGHNGFGWDPIFVPRGWNKTFAEMTPEEKHSLVSMRTAAVLKLKTFLEERGQ